MSLRKKCQIIVSFHIKICEFSNVLVKGRAEEGKILLSDTFVEDSSIRDIMKVILEEQTFIETGHEDLSKKLQNYLFDKWMGTLEDKYGVFF